MAYEGGYTSALNSQQSRETQQAQVQQMLQAIAHQQWQEQQAKEAQQKQKMLDVAKFAAAQQQMAPPPQGAQGPMPQPMAPGQPSQPMQGPPPGAMQPPPQPQNMGATAATPPGAAPPGGGLMPAGWKPSAAAPPTLGGMPPAPPGGAAGSISAPPPTPEAVLPPTLQTMESAIKVVDKMKLPDEQKWPVLQAMSEMMSKQNKEKLEKYRIDEQVKRAGVMAMAEERKRLELESGGKPTALIRNAEYALGKETPEAKEAVGKQVAKAGAPRAGESGVTSLGGYAGTYEEMTSRQKATVDWYATMQLGGDSTWRVGLSRIKGGSELIKAVDERVPERASELNLSPADIGTNKAIRVSTQAALTQNTKDLAMLKPYANMLDQNADILKQLATKAIATDAALANRPINWLRTNASDNPNVAEYLAQIEIVKNEATRVISNPRLVGQMTDTARQEIESIINGTMPINATIRVLERLQNDGHRRISTMETQQQELQSTLKEMFPTGGGAAKPAARGAGTVDETVLKGGVKVKGRGTESAPYMITGDEEYSALDSGKFFVGPDRQLRKKP